MMMVVMVMVMVMVEKKMKGLPPLPYVLDLRTEDHPVRTRQCGGDGDVACSPSIRVLRTAVWFTETARVRP
jgi:hypothetical protein